MTRIFTTIFILLSVPTHAEEKQDNPFLGEQGKVVEKTDWPGEFTKVVAVAYDFTQEKNSDLVVVDKRLHKGVFFSSQALSKSQVATLMASITGKHTPWRPAMCFEPHHGFVFYDKKNAIIGSLSICFGCKSYQASPAGELSRRWDLVGLEKLLNDLGTPFSDNYTKAFKEYKSQSGPGE